MFSKNSRLARCIASAIIVASTALSLGVATANAMTPAQITESGVVNSTWNSINYYWSQKLPSYGIKSYFRPGIYYYDPGSWNTGCGNTSAYPDNSFYCSGDHNIYLDYNWNQRQLNAYGDGAAAFIFAHEWGHHIQKVDGWWDYEKGSNARVELNADCLAGMYLRYGVSSGLLSSADYSEARNWAYNNAGADGSHGTGLLRTQWLDYGYSNGSLPACNAVFY